MEPSILYVSVNQSLEIALYARQKKEVHFPAGPATQATSGSIEAAFGFRSEMFVSGTHRLSCNLHQYITLSLQGSQSKISSAAHQDR